MELLIQSPGKFQVGDVQGEWCVSAGHRLVLSLCSATVVTSSASSTVQTLTHLVNNHLHVTS